MSDYECTCAVKEGKFFPCLKHSAAKKQCDILDEAQRLFGSEQGINSTLPPNHDWQIKPAPTQQEQQAIDRTLWSEIGLAVGRIEASLDPAKGHIHNEFNYLSGLCAKACDRMLKIDDALAGLAALADRLGAIETALEVQGLQQDVIEKKLDERIAPSKTFGDWWHSVGHTHMPKNGEPPIHASIAELAWNAALRAQPKRKRERKGKR